MTLTTVKIGPTTWDYHTGALTPGGVGRVRMETRADGSVRLFPQAKPDEAGGAIETTRTVADEFAAYRLNAAASVLVDARVSIALPGLVLAGVRVTDVRISVTPVRVVDGTRWLVRAAWSFGPREQEDGDVDQLYVPTRVETARVWGDWTPQAAIRCANLSEAGIGSAALVTILADGDPLPDVVGLYVRVFLPQGEDLTRPTSWAPPWYGRIKTVDIGQADGRITAMWSAVDLSDDFDTFLLRGYERKTDGTLVDPGEQLPYNAIPGGERSSAGDGPAGTFVHDRTVTTATLWRGRHIVESLLAALRDQGDGGVDWVVGGQVTALDNFHPANFDGRTLREQLREIIARGLTWRVSVDGNTATVDVRSPLRDTLTAAGWTIPANDEQSTLDLVAMTDLIGWSMGEDQRQVADVVAMELSRPWHVISLGTDAQLVDDWNGSDVTAWDAATEDERNLTLPHVYRRFRLSSTWVGASQQVPGQVLALGRAVATDAIHGTDGETGAWAAGGGFVPQAIRFEKALPYTAGKDWTSPDSQELDPRIPLDRPFALLRDGTAWTFLDVEVTIDPMAPVVILGRDAADADTLRGHLEAGREIVLTLSYRYPLPWRVSWRRDPVDQVVDRARVVRYQRPDIEWRYMHDQTVLGVDDTGAPILSAAGNIGGKPVVPDQLLALARLTHERPFRDLTWSRPGLDVTAATRPGGLITEATLPYGSEAGTVVTLDALRTVRSYNLDRSAPGTAYGCARNVADILMTPAPEPRRFTTLADLSRLTGTG